MAELQLADALVQPTTLDELAEVGLVVAELEASGASLLVDVAGGTGRLLARVVARLPGLRGLLADQGRPVAGAAAVLAARRRRPLRGARHRLRRVRAAGQ